jgi:glycosyltransferase involved in cell wall biosynthesis
MKPAVSINLCCYNSERYLRETIDSIVKQTYKDWELIVINDGSSDSTESIIYEYIKKGYPIIYHCQENKGLGYSRNEALKRSNGEFIALIDHDDIWMPNKLEMQIPCFEKKPTIGFVFSNAIYFSNSSKNIRFNLYGNRKPPSGRIFGELLKRSFICISTVIIKKTALMELEQKFDERFKFGEELDVFLRILYKWESVYVDGYLTMYRMHANSLTSRMPEVIPKEMEMIVSRLKRLYPEIETNYKYELNVMRANIQYLYALEDFCCNRRKDLRKRLAPYLMIEKKLWMPYIFSFLPFSFYKYLLSLKKNQYKF